MDLTRKRTSPKSELTPEEATKIRRELTYYGSRLTQCPMCRMDHVQPRSRKDGIVTVVCQSCGYLMQYDEVIFGMREQH